MIGPAKIKLDALTECERQGRTKFTRVGKTFTDRVDAKLRVAYQAILKDEVQRHPSIGVTLK